MTANKPLIFGITGGSGSGKGYISDIFRELGVTVVDADKVGHEVSAPDGAAYDELLAHFGREYFRPDGTLDRKKLAAWVFSDRGELGILNKIMHKHIKTEILRRIEDSDIAAIDGAVIIGSDVEELCEFLVGVDAPESVRIKRIIERDGISEDMAKARIAAQPDGNFYHEHCKFVIGNNGASHDELIAAVKKILDDARKEGIN